MPRPPNKREEPRFEEYEGKPCVWIQRSDKTWTLVDEEDFYLVRDIPWNNTNGYSGWDSGDSTVYMHNLIFPVADGMIIDHKNRKRWDNRKCNFRLATRSQNQWNRKIQKNNSTGYPGVRKKRDKWHSRINTFGHEISFGCYATFEEAVAARKTAEIQYHGDFRWEASRCQ